MYVDISQGLVTVPFWEYWTSPEKVAMAYRPYTDFGWGDVTHGDISHDPCIMYHGQVLWDGTNLGITGHHVVGLGTPWDFFTWQMAIQNDYPLVN